MTLFIPSKTLISTADESTGAERFIMASGEWVDLQNRLQSIAALPSNMGDYEQRYGDPTSGIQMRECFEAMYNLQLVAEKYGNPKILREKILHDPNIMASSFRPKNDAYAATIWTLERAHQNAFSISSVLNNIPVIAREESASDVVTGIKSLFLDNGQIVYKMGQTVNHLSDLIQEFESVERDLERAQEEMQRYTSRSSKTRTHLDTEIGELEETINQLEQARDAAYNKWLALTISACVVPAVIGVVGIGIMVILAVPTGGTSFAVGSAVTSAAVGIAASALGIAASNARGEYDGLLDKLATKNEFSKKRVNYRNDLGALDELMQFSLPSSSGIVEQVRSVKDAWQGSIDEMRYRVNELNVDNLHTGPWLKDAEMQAASANWVKVDDALKGFMGESYVDADTINFGSTLPEDDPNYQANLAAKFAA